jgi:hypothetical protein
MEDVEPRDSDEGDELEAAIMQADHPFAAELSGTTAEEAAEGASLGERLAQERPDHPSVDAIVSVIDEGLYDDEPELVGEAAMQRDEFASPEEAAITVRDGAPGATDHDDPHPTDATP